MGGGPADVLLVALPGKEPKELLDRLRKEFPKIEIKYVEVSFIATQEELESKVPPEVWRTVTIIATFNFLPAQASDTPKLDLIQLTSAGSNHIQKHPIYTSTDITITTSTGIHGPQIAEWVILTALVQSHHYNALHDLQKQHQWGGRVKSNADDIRNVRDQAGRRIGVLGYGSIGRQVGRVAKALGLDVIAYTATPKDTPEKRRDNGFIVPGTGDEDGSIPSAWFSGLDRASLHNFLAQGIDWLVVSVPLTAQTRHFLGKEEFEILAKNGGPAFVSNIARGEIVNQVELVDALKDGTVAGAALDVTDPEPLPKDSELWDLPNVTITPHVSGSNAAYYERGLQVLELNLKRREEGKKLVNVVNRDRGY